MNFSLGTQSREVHFSSEVGFPREVGFTLWEFIFSDWEVNFSNGEVQFTVREMQFSTSSCEWTDLRERILRMGTALPCLRSGLLVRELWLLHHNFLLLGDHQFNHNEVSTSQIANAKTSENSRSHFAANSRNFSRVKLQRQSTVGLYFGVEIT